MAKTIGETLQTEETPTQVGQAVEGSSLPDDEVTRSPQFKANLEWLKDPTNMMTAIVFLGSVIQPRDPGRNTGQTIAQRGLGALAFRGALGEGQRKEGLEAEEAARRQAALEAETEHRKAQIGVAQEQVAATRENTAQDAATAGMQDSTRRWLGMLEANTARQLAKLTADAKTTGWFPIEEISRQAIDLYTSSLDSDKPLTPQEAFWAVGRSYALGGLMSGKPEAAAMFGLMERDVTKPGAAPDPMAGLSPVDVTARKIKGPPKVGRGAVTPRGSQSIYGRGAKAPPPTPKYKKPELKTPNVRGS